MTTNNTTHSDLYGLYNVVQSSMILYPKELIISQLKDLFSRDSQYHYATDHFGFNQTPDHTNLPQSVGYQDNITTRVYINAAYREDLIYYPAIIIRHGGVNSVPISINRENTSVIWDQMVFEDGYGNITTFPVPQFYIFAGAWEGSINIDVIARDPRARDDLIDLISLLFVDLAFDDMKKAGVIIKPNGGIQVSAASENLDRTDPLFKSTITLQYRSEWRRLIPIASVIDTINFTIDFAVPVTGPIDPNIAITSTQTISDIIGGL